MKAGCDIWKQSCPGSNMDKDEWLERIESYSPAVTRSLNDQAFPQRVRKSNAGRLLWNTEQNALVPYPELACQPSTPLT